MKEPALGLYLNDKEHILVVHLDGLDLSQELS